MDPNQNSSLSEHDAYKEFKLPDFESLTPDQQEAILNGPGWVKEPAQLTQYTDIDDFRSRSNNFKGFFTGKEGSLWDFVRDQTPAYQRFKILLPDVVTSLTQRLQTVYTEQSPEFWEELLQAYRVMSALCDQDDPRVRDPNTGQLDPWYLCR